MVNAVYPVHVPGGNRVDHGQAARLPRGPEAIADRFQHRVRAPQSDEELTDTVAPTGMTAAAASSETHFERVIPIPNALSIAGNLYRPDLSAPIHALLGPPPATGFHPRRSRPAPLRREWPR